MEGEEDDDDDEQWEDIDGEVCIELDHGLGHYEGEYGDENGFYHDATTAATAAAEVASRLNRSDESFHQFIVENTLNIDSAQVGVCLSALVCHEKIFVCVPM